MNIISASRRTDIPGFYPEWFVNRVRAGVVRWPNPYGGGAYEVSLRPEDVSVIVFWSKNYLPLLPFLDELDRYPWGLFFHYTITGLPSVFEPNVPPADLTVSAARSLSERYGPQAFQWRYDPVLISSITGPGYHLKRFAELCAMLEGVTSRCYFSFAQFYGKVRRNASALQAETGIQCVAPSLDERVDLAGQLAGIAEAHGIVMYSCCGDYMVGGKIRKAHCLDAELLSSVYPERLRTATSKPTRKECGCVESRDIGAYDSCPHGCVYCYANTSKKAAAETYARHDSSRDMLTGDSGLGGALAKTVVQSGLPFE